MMAGKVSAGIVPKFAGGGVAAANAMTNGMFQPILPSGSIPDANVNIVSPNLSSGRGAPAPPSSTPPKQQSPMQDIAQTGAAANGAVSLYKDVPDGTMASIKNFFGGADNGVNTAADATGGTSLPDYISSLTGPSLTDQASAMFSQAGIAPAINVMGGDLGGAAGMSMADAGASLGASAAAAAAASAPEDLASLALLAFKRGGGILRRDSGGATNSGGKTEDPDTGLPSSLQDFIENSMLNKGGGARADGGNIEGTETLDNMLMRRESGETFHPSGLLNSAGPGRTDTINTNVPSGAYVVPADVVSGLGEGNTLAGSAVIDRMFSSQPHGIQARPIRQGRGEKIPSPPSSRPESPPTGVQSGPTVNTAAINSAGGYAKGGETQKAPVVVAGGEHVVSPEDIIRKFGSLKKGHAILDHWVVMERKKIANEMLKLPGPVRAKK
jgi:hypothetical protein